MPSPYQHDSVEQSPWEQGGYDSEQHDGVDLCDRELNEYDAVQQRGSGAQCSCVRDGGGSAAVEAAEGELASGSFGMQSEAEAEPELKGHVFGILRGYDLSMVPYLDPSYVRLKGAVSARLEFMGVARSLWTDSVVGACVVGYVEGHGECRAV